MNYAVPFVTLAIFFLAMGVTLFVSWQNLKSAREIAKARRESRDVNTAMVIELADVLSRVESMFKTMREEMADDRGKVSASASVPNMPVLSGARHAAEPSGEFLVSGNGFSPIPLSEALHTNKVTFPVTVTECYVCRCDMFAGPHCHYHECPVAVGADECPYGLRDGGR